MRIYGRAFTECGYTTFVEYERNFGCFAMLQNEISSLEA